MQHLEVGAPYPGYAPDGAVSAQWYHEGPPRIVMTDPGITPEAARELWVGTRLWLLGSGPLVVLLAKLADGSDLEMPQARLADQPMPEWVDNLGMSDDLAGKGEGHRGVAAWVTGLGAEARLAVQLITIDATTGLVAGLKVVSLSPHFTRALAQQVQRRWETPIPQARFMSAISEHQQRYPDLKSMTRAAVASTRLGD